MRCQWEGCEAEAEITYLVRSRRTGERRNTCEAHQASFFATGAWAIKHRNWQPQRKNCCPDDRCQHNLLAHTADGCSHGCPCGLRGGLLPGSATAEQVLAFLTAMGCNGEQ
jgi:hypothetical protein